MGHRFASIMAALRYPPALLVVGVLAGYAATVPDTFAQTSPRDVNRSHDAAASRTSRDINRTLHEPSAPQPVPLIVTRQSPMPQVVTIDYKYPTVQPAAFPEPKKLPPIVKEQNPHLLKT